MLKEVKSNKKIGLGLINNIFYTILKNLVKEKNEN
jgi:hypothetical protein